MAVILRDAHVSDKARCLELLGLLGAATGNTHDIRGGAFDALLAKTRGQITVAEEADLLLGMATVSYNLALRYDGEYCQLEELIVAPEGRGKNIGGQLVQATIDNARARGCAEYGLYLLESTAHNQPFYEKYGFKVIGAEMRQSLTGEHPAG